MSKRTLSDALIVAPPFELKDAPQAFTFSRRRELTRAEFDWNAIYPDGPEGYDSAFLKRYFLRKWGLPAGDWGPEKDAELAAKLFELGHAKPLYPWTWAWSGSAGEEPLGEYAVACLPVLENTTFVISQAPDPRSSENDQKVDVERGPILLKLLPEGSTPGSPVIRENYRPVPEQLDKDVFAPPSDEAEQEFVLCIAFDGGRHSRYYRPFKVINAETNESRPLTRKCFLDQGFKAVHGVEMVFGYHSVNSPTEVFLWEAIDLACAHAQEGFSAVDDYRADAALIMRQWAYLEEQGKVATRMALQAELVLGENRDAADKTLPTSVEAWRARAEQYMELKKPKLEQEPREIQLADAAADLGYRLFLETTQVKVPREGDKELGFETKRGELYLEQIRTTAWTTWHTAHYRRRSLFGSRRVTFQIPKYHSKTYTYFKRVGRPGLDLTGGDARYVEGIDYDPWVEGARAYEKAGYRVFLMLEQEGGDLQTRDGTTLVDVMDQCDRSEEYRRRCVVALPQYENTIAGRRLLAGYRFFVRPNKGLTVADDPVLAFNEALAYKFAWQGTTLGDLVASIPLAPGEEQEITISRTESTETSSTATSRTLVELSTLEKSDFESVFEKEVTQESQKSKSSGLSASVPVGKAVIGGNFSGNSSGRTVARTLNRVVKRAAQEVTRKARQETGVTVGQKVTVTAANSVTHRIKNVNQGTTLNLNLYRLMNRYSSGLWYEDVSFSLTCGAALIEGTDYRETRTFNRINEVMGPDGLLAFLLEGSPVEVPSDKLNEFNCRFLQALLTALKRDYEIAADEKKSNEASNYRFSVLKVRDIPCNTATEESVAELAQRVAENVGPEGGPLAGEEPQFAFESGALYIDSLVGVGRATEPYADRMRNLEEEARRADVALVVAQASSIARAAEDDMDQNPHHLSGAVYNALNRMLALTFSPEARAAEDWSVHINGVAADWTQEATNPEQGKRVYRYRDESFAFLERWTASEWHRGLFVQHATTGERLAFRHRKA